MAECNHIIGLLYQPDTSVPCTLEILERYITERKEINVFARKYMPELARPEYSLKDYADRRKSTDLTRFAICPYCGEKIDWKKVRDMDG